jgi:hypothetical protein
MTAPVTAKGKYKNSSQYKIAIPMKRPGSQDGRSGKISTMEQFHLSKLHSGIKQLPYQNKDNHPNPNAYYRPAPTAIFFKICRTSHPNFGFRGFRRIINNVMASILPYFVDLNGAPSQKKNAVKKCSPGNNYSSAKTGISRIRKHGAHKADKTPDHTFPQVGFAIEKHLIVIWFDVGALAHPSP